MDEMNVGKVGIFWFVQWKGSIRLLSASCPIAEGEPYGDMITYGTGHYTTWNRWKKSIDSPLKRGITKAFEYEEWPRGRISYDKPAKKYVLLCDQKIMSDQFIEQILKEFSISIDDALIGDDPHYISVESYTQ